MAYLNAGLWHMDSVFQARAVEATLATGRLQPMHGAGYPGQVVIGTVFHAVHRLLTGAQSAGPAITVASAVSGAAAVLAMYLLVRRIARSDRAAAAAAIVFALQPLFLSVTTFAMSHGAEACLVLLSAWLVVRARDEGRTRDLVLAGVAFGAAAAVRPTAVLFVPALAVFGWRSGTLRAWAVACVAAAATTLAAYAPLFLADGSAALSAAARDNRFLGVSWGAIRTAASWTAASVTVVGLFSAVLGAIILVRRSRRDAVAVLVWLVVPLVALAGSSTAAPRYLATALAAVAILTGCLAEGRVNRKLYALVLTVQAAWGLVSIHPTLAWRHARCAPAEFARMVGERTQPGAVILTMDLAPQVEYHASRTPRTHPVFRGDPEAFLAEAAADVDAVRELVAGGTPVYLTSDALRTYDMPASPPSGYLDVEIGECREIAGRWGAMILEAFRATPVGSTDYEDWHKASLAAPPRPGSMGARGHLYRLEIRPQTLGGR